MSLFDAQAVSASSFSTGPSQNHTCSGSDRCLWVGIVIEQDKSISGITYNSVSMTEIVNQSIGTNIKLYVFRLVAPSTGSNLINVTVSAGTGYAMSSVSRTGVNQTTPNDTPSTATGNSTAPSASVTSESGDDVIDFVCIDDAGASASNLTPGTGQTERSDSGGLGVMEIASSEEAGAGSVTMSWNISSYATDWIIAGINVNDVGGGGGAGIEVLRRRIEGY